MSLSVPCYSVLLLVCGFMLYSAPDARGAAEAVKADETTVVEQKAQQAVFPKITSRWHKWQLDLIEQHGRKNGWQSLPANSVRIVGQAMDFVGTGLQVDLSSGEVKVLSGPQDVPKIRSFKLQSSELEDLKKLLESKSYRDLAEEGRPPGLDGATQLVESDWKGEYRWRLYWVDKPYPLDAITAIVQKAYQRERP